MRMEAKVTFSKATLTLISVFILSLVAPATAFCQLQQGVDSPRDKLLVIHDRAQRDLDKAEELRSQATIQINNARMIMERAAQNPDDPYLSTHKEALALAPEMLDYGQEVLAKAEKAAQEAKLNLEWTDRALKNLGSKISGQSRGAGMAFSSEHQGKFSIVPQGEDEPRSFPYQLDRLVVGEKVVTGQDGRACFSTAYALGSHLILGPDTSAALIQDNKDATVWRFFQGKIHVGFSVGEDLRQALRNEHRPRVEAVDKIIEGDANSEFDVYMDEKAQVQVKVYRGEVKVKERKKTWLDEYTEHVIKEYSGENKEPQWWEDKK